jgi:hypothetical protein
MTDTKRAGSGPRDTRWSDPSSDVDPVLRSVLRYGGELGPDSSQLQRLLRATEAGTTPAAVSRRARTSRRWATVLAVGLAAAFSGAAWARFAGHWGAPPQEPAPAPSLAPPRGAPASRPASFPAAPPPASIASIEPIPVASPTAKAPPVPSARPETLPAPSAEQDAALLQQARAAVSRDPARALTLTRDHQVRFAASALAEERQALLIEALFRLGRRDEAARELEAFEAHYPRSPYRRRLRALER